MQSLRPALVCAALLGVLALPSAWAQRAPAPSGPAVPPSHLQALSYRNIGPERGGRSIACTGVVGDPLTYYFGATGGGLWKTTDGGLNWAAVTDSFLTAASVGAVAVAPSDPNVLYLGTGERDIRGNISPGDGVYRSTDAGKTWQHIGLKDQSFIGRIAVHPTNPDVAYVASLGRVFGNKTNGGLFRTTDGGKSWKKILSKDEKTGAVHVTLDPTNPRVVYASLWECYRNPWRMSSGGPGSSLYKSTDGGETWVNLSHNPGMPTGVLGKIGVAVSPVNPNRVWAIVENEPGGGLFLSLDGGATWARTSSDRNLRQRAWYYSHVVADPQAEETVYVLNVSCMKSIDGGKTFGRLRTGHGDYHDLWLDPHNPNRMIVADDGGAEVTENGGRSWTDLDLPTAQFYHVTLDNQFPYRVYGAQQDNSTLSGPSRTLGYGIGLQEWYPVAGGESGYIAVDPRTPEVTYGGSYGGYLTRYDKRTDQERSVSPYPNNPMGSGAGANKYRFQWTYPIVFSPHDPKTLYATAQVVFKTQNEGQTWTVISPDLTRADSTKLLSSGGPITQDNTSVEYYGTIFAFAESPAQKDLLWAGSDDGRVHVSQDGGANWKDVTPKGLPEWALISILEPSRSSAGTCYLAATRYKLDDFKPYLFKTTDFGATWTAITTGIPATHFTHVVREDPNQPKLLYAGTEFGVYVSFDGGARWQPLQLNLPVTPVRDLAVHAREKDLVIAAHGRSFWILDDLTPLHQLAESLPSAPAALLAPRHSYRLGGGGGGQAVGSNPPNGVLVHYTLGAPLGAKDTLRLEVLDAEGKVLRTFTNHTRPNGKPLERDNTFYPDPDGTPYGVLTTHVGLNRFVWDMRTEPATELPGAVLWGGQPAGPKVLPGFYTLRLTLGETVATQRAEIRLDPRLQTKLPELEAQFAFAQAVKAKISEVHQAINRLRTVREAVNGQLAKLEGAEKDSLRAAAKPLLTGLTEVEEALYQTKAKAGQDLLNYPIRLGNKLTLLAQEVEGADAPPTDAARQVLADLTPPIDAELAKLKTLLEGEVPKLNALISALALPAIRWQEPK